MDTNEALADARRYLAIVRNIMNVDEAYLFGSYANGTFRDDSDIDLAIFTTEFPPDYFDTLKTLFKERRKINHNIEPHLFIKGYDETGFGEEVRNLGVRITTTDGD
jgi:predicted nucleotidyltransferase